MEQSSWVTLLGFAGFALALFTYLGTMKRDLRAETRGFRDELKADLGGLRSELKGDIAGLRTELKGDIAGLRTELKGDIAGLRTEMKSEFAKVDGRLTTLEQRTYDLASRLPTSPG